MTNGWNHFIYKLWSPIYDRLFNRGRFLEARRQVFRNLNWKNEDHILFVGVGTGSDLEQVDVNRFDITAIDLSGAMLNQAKEKFADRPVRFQVMDAQQLAYADDQFDVVVGSLILSVVPNPVQCLDEMLRVIRPGGQLIIFDKFSPKDGQRPSIVQRLSRPIIKWFGTDIGLSFESLWETRQIDGTLIEDVPVMMNGMYRKMVIMKAIPEHT